MGNFIKKETNAEYHGNEVVSKSRLANMSVCPQYFKWVLENPEEPTDALIVGSAFHKWVLEPEDFTKEFAILPIIDRRTKQGKEDYANFVAENEGKAVITQEQFATIDGMRNALLSNTYISKLLDGEKEQSFYFMDELTNIMCKVRPDCYKIVGDKVIITDLKSCKSAMPEMFMKDIVNYSYDLQAYMYRLGVSLVLGVPIENVMFVFVAVEKEAPFLSAIYECTQDIYDRGEMLFRKYIGMLKYCTDTNNWYGFNGHTNEPMTIGLPEWAKSKENSNKGE